MIKTSLWIKILFVSQIKFLSVERESNNMLGNTWSYCKPRFLCYFLKVRLYTHLQLQLSSLATYLFCLLPCPLCCSSHVQTHNHKLYSILLLLSEMFLVFMEIWIFQLQICPHQCTYWCTWHRYRAENEFTNDKTINYFSVSKSRSDVLISILARLSRTNKHHGRSKHMGSEYTCEKVGISPSKNLIEKLHCKYIFKACSAITLIYGNTAWICGLSLLVLITKQANKISYLDRLK